MLYEMLYDLKLTLLRWIDEAFQRNQGERENSRSELGIPKIRGMVANRVSAAAFQHAWSLML
jgi:hypothetical protein